LRAGLAHAELYLKHLILWSVKFFKFNALNVKFFRFNAMMHIIKILPALKAISASCDSILMNLGCFEALNVLHLVVLV